MASAACSSEHQLGHRLRPGVVGRDDPGHSAHAGPDDDHRPADLIEHCENVAGQRVDAVLPGRCAVAVTVSAGIQCHHVKTVIGQHLTGVLPGEPVLAAAVQHQDRGRPVAGVGGGTVPLVARQ
jgi:hypothetical protein